MKKSANNYLIVFVFFISVLKSTIYASPADVTERALLEKTKNDVTNKKKNDSSPRNRFGKKQGISKKPVLLKKHEIKKKKPPRFPPPLDFEKIQNESTEIQIDRYLVKGGLVTDTSTGLMWMRCSLGQNWDGVTCLGSIEGYTWEDAKGVSQSNPTSVDGEVMEFSYGGYNDWRIPTLNELKTLVYCNSNQPKKWNDTDKACEGDYSQPTIMSDIFPQTYPDQTALYWSSEPNGAFAAGVLFFTGETKYSLQSDTNAVRLVRSKK